MTLTPEQNEALQQLVAVTASSTPVARERDERLLRENGWNVQVTVEQIFALGDSQPSGADDRSSGGPSSTRIAEAAQFEVDDEDQDQDLLLPRIPPGGRRLSGSAPGARNRPRTPPGGVGLGLWGIIAWPVSMVVSLVGGIWYFFIRTFVPLSLLPRFPSFLLPPSSPQTYSRSNRFPQLQDPTTSSLRFIRDLELFTRCSSSSGTLPEFYIGPYREFVNTLRKDGKLGAVLLVCKEHEDDEEFKRDVLCDHELIRFFKEREILIWAADISSREGYQVAQTLLSTTYPSITFLSLLPVPSSPQPRLTIISTISGSPSGPMSTTSILQVLSTSILPRTSSFLSRLKRERLSLEEARHLRAEQDRAFKLAEKRDREKVESQRRQETIAQAEKARMEMEERERENQILKRGQWRRYARKHLLTPISHGGGSVRIALRTPLSPERHIRYFQPSSSTIQLYIYAETLLIPSTDSASDDPDTPPAGFRLPNFNEDFKLVTAYPRKEIPYVEDGAEGLWELISKAGGALFAEKVNGSSWGQTDDQDSDEEIVE